MEEISSILAVYLTPSSLIVFIAGGVWLYVKSRYVSSLFIAIGAFLSLLNIVTQRYFPTFSATLDEHGELISWKGPTIQTYIFSVLGTLGLFLCAVSFAVLAYKVSRGGNYT
jgi:hypothetical protein